VFSCILTITSDLEAVFILITNDLEYMFIIITNDTDAVFSCITNDTRAVCSSSVKMLHMLIISHDPSCVHHHHQWSRSCVHHHLLITNGPEGVFSCILTITNDLEAVFPHHQ
jgi:hypothetical protein